MCIDPLGDHVLCCKKHTGSIRGHNHLMDVLAMLARASNIGPDKVSTTGDGTRKQGDVEIQNFPLSLCDSVVIDVSFVCEFTGSSRALGGLNNGVRHTIDVLKGRATVMNNKYSEAYGFVGMMAESIGILTNLTQLVMGAVQSWAYQHQLSL